MHIYMYIYVYTHTHTHTHTHRASLVAQTVKNLPAMQEAQVQSLGQKDTLEKGKASHSSILTLRTPWTEEPGRLQSVVPKSDTDTTKKENFLCSIFALILQGNISDGHRHKNPQQNTSNLSLLANNIIKGSNT